VPASSRCLQIPANGAAFGALAGTAILDLLSHPSQAITICGDSESLAQANSSSSALTSFLPLDLIRRRRGPRRLAPHALPADQRPCGTFPWHGNPAVEGFWALAGKLAATPQRCNIS